MSSWERNDWEILENSKCLAFLCITLLDIIAQDVSIRFLLLTFFSKSFNEIMSLCLNYVSLFIYLFL